MRFILDAVVGMPDKMTPAFRRKPEAERISPDHIDIVTSRRLAPDDFGGATLSQPSKSALAWRSNLLTRSQNTSLIGPVRMTSRHDSFLGRPRGA
jgi:hypothetical protein